jgi:hypothetical protein
VSGAGWQVLLAIVLGLCALAAATRRVRLPHLRQPWGGGTRAGRVRRGRWQAFLAYLLAAAAFALALVNLIGAVTPGGVPLAPMAPVATFANTGGVTFSPGPAATFATTGGVTVSPSSVATYHIIPSASPGG